MSKHAGFPRFESWKNEHMLILGNFTLSPTWLDLWKLEKRSWPELWAANLTDSSSFYKAIPSVYSNEELLMLYDIMVSSQSKFARPAKCRKTQESADTFWRRFCNPFRRVLLRQGSLVSQITFLFHLVQNRISCNRWAYLLSLKPLQLKDKLCLYCQRYLIDILQLTCSNMLYSLDKPSNSRGLINYLNRPIFKVSFQLLVTLFTDFFTVSSHTIWQPCYSCNF